jgi:hypothetical protein
VAFEELKERQAMVWGSAPFENAPAEYLIILGRRK